MRLVPHCREPYDGPLSRVPAVSPGATDRRLGVHSLPTPLSQDEPPRIALTGAAARVAEVPLEGAHDRTKRRWWRGAGTRDYLAMVADDASR